MTCYNGGHAYRRRVVEGRLFFSEFLFESLLQLCPKIKCYLRRCAFMQNVTVVTRIENAQFIPFP